jgi:capsid protein
LASKYLAFVKKDPAARDFQLDDDDEDDTKKIDNMENAIIEYLAEGESIEIAKHNLPGGNFPPTVKLLVCLLSAATGVPYELLIFDYAGITYTSTRVIRNDYAHQLKPIRRRHIRGMMQPIATDFLDYAVFHNRIKLPNYWEQRHRYQRFGWTIPGTESVDWLKESKAAIGEMGVALRSPQEIVSMRGRDLDDVIRETQLAVQKLKDAKLEFLIPLIWQSPSLANANNPEAVEGQGPKGNGDLKKARQLAEARATNGMTQPEAIAFNRKISGLLEDMSHEINDLRSEY